ncbi:MAG: amidohydrolase family protein [Actinomycetota bacterium]|jgi:imidazolonepropionase-like amidohydrolase|nr:amidohydrolase family protein [Actinomycetota bacterium]
MADESRRGPIKLTADQVFDGEAFLGRADVILDDGKIVAAGPDLRSDLVSTDLGSATILPGLVDCHQHLVFDGNGTLEDQVVERSDDELLERAREAARRALLGGVTTLRDLGDRGFVTLGLRGDPELPTLVCAGPPITTVHGHCWYLGGECDGTGSLRRAVAERIDRGCDVVKVMVTGGAMTPTMPMWSSQFALDELRMVVEDAHAAGLPVAAHCHGLGGIADAIEAGVDTIEHCSFMNEDLQPDPSEELLAAIGTSNTAISATFGRLPDAPPLDPEMAAKRPKVKAAMHRVHQLGGSVVLGSDAGIALAKPHDVAAHAIHEFMEMGFDTTQSLRSMTSRGADALGQDRKGRFRAGDDADVLVVMGDVETTPAALADVMQVWKMGQLVIATGEDGQ